MRAYRPPVRDVDFALQVIGEVDDLAKMTSFAHTDADVIRDLLAEFGRFVAEVIAPLNELGDRHGVEHDPVSGDVRVRPEMKDAYRQYTEAGWGSVAMDPTYGGGGFPWAVNIAMQELLDAANLAFSLCPLLTQGAIDALEHHGTEEQKETYLRKMVEGTWTGTMNLTEPDAGSDVGALRSRAVPAGDGSYRIFGQKIFITYGEHDQAENIVHLVLARVEGSPPGTRGITCFIVPKFLPEPDGTPGRRNDVKCVSIEHKLGIHASPTCVLSFGDAGDGAVGWVLSEVDAGMRTMFTMMNNARLSVGVQGLALGERAYQAAAAHAAEREQGRAPHEQGPGSSPIAEHPDVRRMLRWMRAHVEAMRALTYANARALDLSRHHPDEQVRAAAADRADLLTPLSKAWCTDVGFEVTSLGVQVHGGMGYVEETGAAQLLRDARIAPIYEGTNGIQALDLYGRKLPMRGGAVMAELLDEMDSAAQRLRASTDEALREIGTGLGPAVAELRRLSAWMLGAGRERPVDGMAGATPFLRIAGSVVGGWLLARLAQAAVQQAAVAGDPDGFLADKVLNARFFVSQVLPADLGLAASVTAGADVLYAGTAPAGW